jgi:redox-sensitive bicupin YhaK (pirin superfamily)
MPYTRTTFHKIVAIETQEGQGAHVKRLFPSPHLSHIDPFILLDEFLLVPEAGLPSHTHHGFEAITYMHEGSIRHKDDMGNDSEVLQGGAQRWTAGKGIIHSEMPGKAPMNHGFQLWINLPVDLKNVEPSYQQISNLQMPDLLLDNIRVRTIVGGDSPLKLHTPVMFQEIDIVQTSTSIVLPEGFTGFLYVYAGKIKTGKITLSAGEGIVLGPQKEIDIQSPTSSGFI